MTFLRRVNKQPYRAQLVGAASVARLPARPLVRIPEVERLRRKFAESQSQADREAFWKAVQASKQPVIESQPDTLPPYLRASVGDEYH